MTARAIGVVHVVFARLGVLGGEHIKPIAVFETADDAAAVTKSCRDSPQKAGFTTSVKFETMTAPFIVIADSDADAEERIDLVRRAIALGGLNTTEE